MTLLIFDNDTRKPIYARSGALIPQANHSDVLNASIGQTTEAVKRRTDYLLGVMSKKGKRNCVVRSFSSYLYNCVGMIFASRRAWIEINEIYHIFREDGYRKIKYDALGAPVSFGVRRILMTLDKFFCKMDSLEFQVQFSVLSGFSSVRRAFARDETVKYMIKALRDDKPKKTRAVYEHIRYLLNKSDSQMFDESIAAYLYCLQQVDYVLAEKASKLVLKKGGVWWSIHLALHTIKLFAQLKESITFAPTKHASARYTTGRNSTLDNSLSHGKTATQMIYSGNECVRYPNELEFVQ